VITHYFERRFNHDGFLFDKDGEALVVRANRRCAALSRSVQRLKGAGLSAGLEISIALVDADSSIVYLVSWYVPAS
jgi:hypothetical protein